MTAGRNEVTPPYKITFRIIFIIVRTLTRGETMETITFTADLERNIRMMQELFRNDDTLIIRRAIGFVFTITFPVSYTHLTLPTKRIV